MTLNISQGSRLHKLPTGQHILIDAIWRLHGGLRQTTKRIFSEDITEGQLNMWRKRGKVPLKHVGEVSKALNIPAAALNFIEISKLFGNDKTWEQVVKACGLEKSVINKVLQAKKPRL